MGMCNLSLFYQFAASLLESSVGGQIDLFSSCRPVHYCFLFRINHCSLIYRDQPAELKDAALVATCPCVGRNVSKVL